MRKSTNDSNSHVPEFWPAGFSWRSSWRATASHRVGTPDFFPLHYKTQFQFKQKLRSTTYICRGLELKLYNIMFSVFASWKMCCTYYCKQPDRSMTRDFRLQVFSCISVPRALEYFIGAVSIFFKLEKTQPICLGALVFRIRAGICTSKMKWQPETLSE